MNTVKPELVQHELDKIFAEVELALFLLDFNKPLAYALLNDDDPQWHRYVVDQVELMQND